MIPAWVFSDKCHILSNTKKKKIGKVFAQHWEYNQKDDFNQWEITAYGDDLLHITRQNTMGYLYISFRDLHALLPIFKMFPLDNWIIKKSDTFSREYLVNNNSWKNQYIFYSVKLSELVIALKIYDGGLDLQSISEEISGHVIKTLEKSYLSNEGFPHWSYFIPDRYKLTWELLDMNTKLVLYFLAREEATKAEIRSDWDN